MDDQILSDDVINPLVNPNLDIDDEISGIDLDPLDDTVLDDDEIADWN